MTALVGTEEGKPLTSQAPEEGKPLTPQAPQAPADWWVRLPRRRPDYIHFFPVEGRGIGMFVGRDFEPGDTVLEDQPFFTRPPPDVVARRDDWTPEWADAFSQIKAPLLYPGRSENEVRIHANPGMVRNALGFATSPPRVQRELLKLWHPPPDAEHPVVGLGWRVAELCIGRLKECKGLEAEKLQVAILAIEMNLFAGGHVFQLFSRINHSCFPNVVYIASKDSWRLKALRPIKCGDELTHSYLAQQQLMPVEQRRWHLWRSKCFVCLCERCTAAVEPLRAVPCRNCNRPRHWRVAHKPGVWRRDAPSTEAAQLGFLRIGTALRTTGRTEGDWVELEPAGSGWVLTEGRGLGLGTLCTPEASQALWGSYRHLFFRYEAPEPRLPREVQEQKVWNVALPPCCLADPESDAVAYAQFEGDRWRCSACGSLYQDAALLELEKVLGRLAERTFFSPQIGHGGGMSVGTDNSPRIIMLESEFVIDAIGLAEVVTQVLGHRHWTSQWARILFTDIAGSLREFGSDKVATQYMREPLRDLSLLWTWLESLDLAQGPGCWLQTRTARFVQARERDLPKDADEAAIAWYSALERRQLGEQPLVDLLPLRNYVMEGSITFG